jgi:hypothetical protein
MTSQGMALLLPVMHPCTSDMEAEARGTGKPITESPT